MYPIQNLYVSHTESLKYMDASNMQCRPARTEDKKLHSYLSNEIIHLTEKIIKSRRRILEKHLWIIT